MAPPEPRWLDPAAPRLAHLTRAHLLAIEAEALRAWRAWFDGLGIPFVARARRWPDEIDCATGLWPRCLFEAGVRLGLLPSGDANAAKAAKNAAA